MASTQKPLVNVVNYRNDQILMSVVSSSDQVK